MATYRRKNGRWYVYITFPDGRRYRRYVGIKKRCEQIEKKIRAQIEQGKWDHDLEGSEKSFESRRVTLIRLF